MNYLKNFLFLAIITITAFFCSGGAYAAVYHNHELYQFDDVTGTSGSGAQWVGFSDHEPYNIIHEYEGTAHNSTGGSTAGRNEVPAVPMLVSADLISGNNPAYLHGDKSGLRYPLDVLFLVVPEGIGTLPVTFGYDGNLSAVTLGVYGGNFENSYPSIVNYPTPGEGPSVNVELTVQKRSGERTVYDSNEGEIIFHQNPSVTPSQTLHVPFVIANVHDGSARDVPLDMKITTRNTNGDIVGRRWFNWDATADRTVPANPVDWIFVPIDDPVIDNNTGFIYNFTTEVTNHTGLRYGLQRYDDLNEQYDMDTIEPAHWKFDLQPVNDSLHYLNNPLHLDPLSHIAPGLVTFYSHNGEVNAGRQELFRLGAVDNTDEIIGSKLLTFAYRTVYGYRLDSVQETPAANSFWGLNAFRVYQSNRNFFSNVLNTMEIRNINYFFPSRASGVLQGAVENTFPPITADALSSFTLSAPVPLADIDVLSKDADGNDIWVSADVFPDDASAMLGLNVMLRIPRNNRFIAERWDDFAASRNLANDFARYFSVWFRSPSGIDMDISRYLKEESKYDRTVKVFIDEENEYVVVNYITLLIERGARGETRRPMIRVVSDTSSVNDYDYITVNDGIDNGKWDLNFYLAPVETTPTPTLTTTPTTTQNPSNTEEGSGCAAFFIPFWAISALFFLPVKRWIKITGSTLLFIFALSFIAFAAEPPYTIYEVVYDNDDPSYSGTFRNAINSVNARPTGSDEILVNNLVQINVESPIEFSGASLDVVIEGNGASVSGNGTFRLFQITNGAKVEFRNMTFINGSSVEDGAAVLVEQGCSVSFDKCTFTQNKASRNGGAVYSDGASFFTNCTFFNNYSGNNGGAVFGGANSALSFSFVTMSSNECASINGGHAVNAGGANTFQASVFAGNGIGGIEVACSTRSQSLGYNVYEDDSFQGTDHETDLYGKSAVDIFGSAPIIRRNDAAPGWRNWPYTLALTNRSGNPAMGIVPASYIESVGVLVDQRFIARAESRPASAGAFEVYNPSEPVTSLEIGGVPNGIATIGFTAQLRAYVLPVSAEPGVMWSSSDPSVVAVTPYGRVYSIRSGIVLLSVTSTGYDSSGENIKKSVFVEVGDDYANSNIPPELAYMLEILNADVLGPNSMRFYLPGGKEEFAAEADFIQMYDKSPSVINPLPENSIVLSNKSIDNIDSNNALIKKTALRPSVKFSAPTGTNSEAGIVPFLLSISLSAQEISNLTGNSDFSSEQFFKRAAFCTGNNGENVLLDDGTKGISAKEAENKGALAIKNEGGNITFVLNGWFADTAKTSSVIDGQIILSDENSNGFIDSEIWLVTSSAVNAETPGESEESSGGCNSWMGGIVLLTMIPLFLRNAKKFLLLFLFLLLIFSYSDAAYAAISWNVSKARVAVIMENSDTHSFTLQIDEPTDRASFDFKWSYDTTLFTFNSESRDGPTIGLAVNGDPLAPDQYNEQTVISCDISDKANPADTVSVPFTIYIARAGMTDQTRIPPQILYYGFEDTMNLVPQIEYDALNAEAITSISSWQNGDTSVASVDINGVVTATGRGKTTVTFIAWAVSANPADEIPSRFDIPCEITVVKPLLSMDIIQNPSPVSVYGQGDIEVAFYPTDADSKDIEFTILSNDNYATITPSAISPSTSPATVTFHANEFPGPYTIPHSSSNPLTVNVSSTYWKNFKSFVPDESCEVIIHPIPITQVTLTPPLVMSLDATLKLSEDIVPANATKASDHIWVSSNPLFATVTQDGFVSAVRQGESKITYTFNGWSINDDNTHSAASRSASSTVIVTSPPPGIRVTDIIIEPTKLRLPKGASFQMSAEVIPYNVTNKSVHWASGNLLVANVNANGLVTAFNPGTTYISVIPADRGVDGNVGPTVCEITVYDNSDVSDDPSNVNITPGLQSKIDEMNSPLIREGVEVDFGFLRNKPEDENLSHYGNYPTIIETLNELSNIQINLAKPVATELEVQNMVPVASSAEFEVNVSAYNYLGTPILPVSLKIMITENILRNYLPAYPVEDLIRNPRQYLNPLFSTFSFQKQIVDLANNVNVTNIRFVPLLNSLTAALEAESLGIISLRGVGDKLEVTLNYYVADSSNVIASIVDGNLIIGDGVKNGVIRDPIWITARKINTGPGSTQPNPNSNNEDEEGSGCNTTGINFAGFIIVTMLYFTSRGNGKIK